MKNLISTLLQSGNQISVESGRLIISSPAKNIAPMSSQYMEQCKREILSRLNIEAYQYESYDTGFYGINKNLQGITLQFQSITGESAPYAIFNAILTRQRNVATGKAGVPLSGKKFKVGKKHLFYHFWIHTGLPVPKSLTMFYERMGKLKKILFVATVNNGRVDTQSLKTLNVSSTTIHNAFLSVNPPITSQQISDNARIKTSDKHFDQTQATQGLSDDQSTYDNKHDKTVISKQRHKTNVVPLISNSKSKGSTASEWLDDFIARHQ